MLGKTHMKIGILSGAIISTVPVINSCVVFNNRFIHTPKGINIAGLALAALAALVVDADSQHSKINQMNVATGLVYGAINSVEYMLKTILSMAFTVGLAAFILYNSNIIIHQISTFKQLKPYAYNITYGTAVLLFILGTLGNKITRYIPGIGNIYACIFSIFDSLASLIKKIWTYFVYIGGGLYLMYYNYMNIHDVMIYLIGVLLIVIAIFPHRSFLHSIEGVFLFTICASYILSKLGYEYLNGYFFIGYLSHIYWADIFTTEGVPFSVIPMILEKVGADAILIKFKAYKIIKGILDIRLRIPPFMRTGSVSGNVFETSYVLILIAAFALIFDKFGGAIKLI